MNIPMNMPVTEIRPIRNITKVQPTTSHLRLDLEFDDLFKNSIKYILAYANNPLEIENSIANINSSSTLEAQSFYTVKTIMQTLHNNAYNLPSLRFAQCPPIKTNQPDTDAILSYLLTCKPAKISTVLTLLAVYKQFTISCKEKWRKMYSTSHYRWYGREGTLLGALSSYICSHYVLENLRFDNRTGLENQSRYGAKVPNIHWLWESQDPWFTNDLEFDALASLVVKSGLVTVYILYNENSRAGGFNMNMLNLCVTPEITEEFLTDHLKMCLNPDHYALTLDNSIVFRHHGCLNPRAVPAEATAIKEKFKRFNRIRTQILMRVPYLLDDPSLFGADFMTLEFEAESRPELKALTENYRRLCGTMFNMKGMPTRPLTEYLTINREYAENYSRELAERRYIAHTAPAVAICKVMSATYKCAESLAILESHVNEYR